MSGDQVHVDLLEDDDEAPSSAPDAAAPGPRPSRGRRRVGLAVAVVTVVAVVGINVVEHVGRVGERARLAAVPGLAASLARAPEVLWEEPNGRLLGGVADVLLLDDVSGVRGVDATTGETLWTREDVRSCEVVAPPVDLFTWDEIVVRAEGAVQCEVSGEGDGLTMIAVDPRSGVERSRVELPGVAVHSEQIGDELVTVTASGDGALHLARWAPGSGDVLWTADHGGLLEPGFARPVVDQIDPSGVTVRAADGGVRLSFEDGSATVVPLDDDGSFDQGSTPPVRMPAPGGGTIEATFSMDGPTSHVTDADGGTRFRADGIVLAAPVHDPATGMLLLADLSLSWAGIDAGTGEERWRMTAPPSSWQEPLAAVADVVVLGTDEGLLTVDARDGAELWESTDESFQAGDGAVPTLVTDGRVVVTLEGSRSAVELVARDLRTGEERWRTEAPDYVERLYVADGVLVVRTSVGVVALGTP